MPLRIFRPVTDPCGFSSILIDIRAVFPPEMQAMLSTSCLTGRKSASHVDMIAFAEGGGSGKLSPSQKSCKSV